MKKLLLLFFGLAYLTFSFAKVNINTATQEELTTLSGIGAVKAAEIIKYRQENGQFKKVEDITKVKGIGPGIFNHIQDEITVIKTDKKIKKSVVKANQ